MIYQNHPSRVTRRFLSKGLICSFSEKLLQLCQTSSMLDAPFSCFNQDSTKPRTSHHSKRGSV